MSELNEAPDFLLVKTQFFFSNLTYNLIAFKNKTPPSNAIEESQTEKEKKV